MTPEKFKRVDELFNEVRGMPSESRGRFLAHACGDDAELRREVESLLGFDDRPQTYLKTPAIKAGLHLTMGGVAPPPWLKVHTPERIGHYKVDRIIGEGGFGVVYLAEQESPRRTVALKVMKPHLSSPQMLRRFEYEAMVLARLQHPGIAQVFEAGTTPGPHGTQAYFAMEYVEGKPLDKFAKAADLSVEQRLELVARVCDAVQYAHQRGVIHRDLKPGNILVVDTGPRTEVSSTGPRSSLSPGPLVLRSSVMPKILDFGVAKMVDAEVEYTTIRTSTGQFIGTLPYMSPEQVAGDTSEVDTRNDVYTLGVILYQLLAGELPFDFKSCPIPEAARRIRDDNPTRLGIVNRALRGEIEIIVSKAIEKDRRRRYQSAADLAADLRRYLRGEPIEARRDSTLYVLRKTLRRYWAAAMAAAAFVLLLGWFGLYATMQSRSLRQIALSESIARNDALRSLGLANEQRTRADLSAARLAAELSTSNIERGRLYGRTGSHAAAERLLWREHLASPDSTHSKWALWEFHASEAWATSLRAHTSTTVGLAFTPDSRTLISAGADGAVRIWDVDSWTCRATLQPHNDPIHGMDLSPDGRYFATSARDARVVVYDLRACDVRCVLPGTKSDLSAVCFLADNRHLATVAADDDSLRIWDVESAALAREKRLTSRGGGYLSPTPDHRGVIVTARDNSFHIFPDPLGDIDLQLVLRNTLPNNQRTIVTTDGRRMFCNGNDRTLGVWDLEEGRIVATSQSPNDTIAFLALTPDGRHVVSTGWWSINYWDAQTGEYQRGLSTVENNACLAFSGDGRLIAAGSASGAVRVYEVGPSRARRRYDGAATRCAASLSPNGRVLGVGDAAGMMRLWDTMRGDLLAEWQAAAGRVYFANFDRRGERVASGAPGLLAIWDLHTGSCLAEYPLWARTRTSMQWSEDNTWFAYMGADHAVHIVDADTFRQIRQFDVGDAGEPISLAISHDGQFIATIARNGPVRVWTTDGRLVSSIGADATHWSCKFSLDDRLLAVGNWGWKVNLYDWREEALVAQLEGHTSTVWSVDFCPTDPRLLATCGSDGTVRLFDIVDQRCVLTLEELKGAEVISVAFDDSGTKLSAANSAGSAFVWDLAYYDAHIAGQVEYEIEQLRAELGDRLQAGALRAWAARVIHAAQRRRAADETAVPTPIERAIADWGASIRAVTAAAEFGKSEPAVAP